MNLELNILIFPIVQVELVPELSSMKGRLKPDHSFNPWISACLELQYALDDIFSITLNNTFPLSFLSDLGPRLFKNQSIKDSDWHSH